MTQTSGASLDTARLPLALDAMGGDHAPDAVIAGGLAYARETGRRVLLVGRPDAIEKSLAAQKGNGAAVEIVPASEVIEFGDKITAIRGKRDSSIHVGTRMVRDGKAAAFVSAGHTGAVMAIAKVVYGLLDGVDRPALPATLPRPTGGHTVLLDAGANLDCKPEHFRQFAVMGYSYARRVLGVANPKVALLSIGEEDSKGNETGKEVAQILRETPVNFIGNIEGNYLFTDRADVVVCDGFVGNVALKVAEGIAETIGGMIKTELKRGPKGWIAIPIVAWVLQPLRKKVDYAEVGGVPLLGLRNISIIAHGRSNPKAIMNALRAADAAIKGRVVEQIASEIAVLHEAEQRLAEKALR